MPIRQVSHVREVIPGTPGATRVTPPSPPTCGAEYSGGHYNARPLTESTEQTDASTPLEQTDPAKLLHDRSPWALGIAAMKAYLLPGVILWCVGLAIVLGYFFVEPVRGLLDRVGAVKAEYGLWYSIPALAFFAGFLPFCFQALSADRRRSFAMGQLVFLLIFWGSKGAEVDLLYRLQVVLFGDNREPWTIVKKVVVDQLVYVPVWAIPSTVIPYLWANKGFRWAPVSRALRGRWYRQLVLPVMLSNWMVWIPAVSMVYLFPPPLQLPIQNIIACLWACMVLFMGHAEAAATPDVEPDARTA